MVKLCFNPGRQVKAVIPAPVSRPSEAGALRVPRGCRSSAPGAAPKGWQSVGCCLRQPARSGREVPSVTAYVVPCQWVSGQPPLADFWSHHPCRIPLS